MLQAGFLEGLEHEGIQRIHHPSLLQIPVIQLLGSPDLSVLPGQDAQGFQLLWLAEGLGSVSAFSSVSCSSAMGSGSGVYYSFNCPTWREEGDGQGAAPYIAVPVFFPTTSSSGCHISCKRGMQMFPPHSSSPSV